MDCVYCEVGKTTYLTLERRAYHSWELIEKSILIAKEREDSFDFFTFTGSGEPTLNIFFREAITLAKKLISKPLAVLTNSSLVHCEDIMEALGKVEVVLPSLDAATQETFIKLNQPVSNLKIDDIIIGLKELRQRMQGKMWLEIFFVRGFNDSEEEILQLKNAVKKINPHKVQINTVVRPPAYEVANPICFEKLQRIARHIGERAEIIVEREKLERTQRKTQDLEKLERDILRYLQMRPATLEELSEAFNLPKTALEPFLEKLFSLSKIRRKKLGEKTFYVGN